MELWESIRLSPEKKKDPSILNYVFKTAEPMSLSEINQRIKLARISTTESDLCQ